MTTQVSSGGQFVAHVALPGNPYDGPTLGTVIPAMEQMIGNTIERAPTNLHRRPEASRYSADQTRVQAACCGLLLRWLRLLLQKILAAQLIIFGFQPA